MKRLFAIIFNLVGIVSVYAMQVRCIGTAAMATQSGDTLFFFKGDPHMRSLRGTPLDWYRTDGTLIQLNADEVYIEDSTSVMVTVPGHKEDSVLSVFHVFDYTKHMPKVDSMLIVPSCTATDLSFPACAGNNLPCLCYTTQFAMQRYFYYPCTIRYTDLTWGGTDWVDTLYTIETQIRPTTVQSISPLYKASVQLTLTYDTIGAQLGYQQRVYDCTINDTKAILCHPTSVTAIRNELNEKERPASEDIVSGSAPLNILFKANPTPNVEFYKWHFYYQNYLIATRTGEQQRYEFIDRGDYRVVVSWSNSYCPCLSAETCVEDSAEFAITISESMLLVPNAFSPNGDGANDEFRVIYRSLREFHCEIYNRWGKLVYSWDDPQKGWDGTINGHPAAEGAYFYVIRALGTDAEDGYRTRSSYKRARENGEAVGVYQLSGDINLLRGKKH